MPAGRGLPPLILLVHPFRSMTTSRPLSARRGFTLIELLTVIAIIGILAAILIPTISKVRENAKRARCASNVRQLSAALINLANQDRQQRFPSIGNPLYGTNPTGGTPLGAMPWDILKDRVAGTPALQLTLSDLVNTAGRDVAVCPSVKPLENDAGFSTYAYATIDYILLVGRTGAGPATVKNSPANVFYSEKLLTSYKTLDIKNGGLTEVPPSRRELVVDAVGLRQASWEWVTVNLQKPGTNHVNGNIAAGANIGFVDGHVAWRSIDQMREISGSNIPFARTGQAQGAVFVW